MRQQAIWKHLAGYWDQCKSLFVTMTRGDNVTFHKFQNSRGNPPPLYYLRQCSSSNPKRTLCMKYESLSLFSGLNTKPATVHNQSCARTCDENTPSFRICRFPRQHHFPQQIIIRRILYWKGLLLPQRAGNTHHVSSFPPLPRIANISFTTLRTKSQTEYFPTKIKNRKLSSTLPLSYCWNCPWQYFEKPPEM